MFVYASCSVLSASNDTVFIKHKYAWNDVECLIKKNYVSNFGKDSHNSRIEVGTNSTRAKMTIQVLRRISTNRIV